MKHIHCPICGPDNDFKVRWAEKFDKAALQFTARKTPDKMHFRVVQCSSCGLVYSNPILPPDQIIALYRKSNFIAERQVDNMIEDYRTQLEEISGIAGDENLLEIGCANGLLLSRVKGNGFKNVYGIEPSQSAITHAPADVRDNIINDELKPGLFPPQHFDVVCAFQVFDHIIDPNGFLQMTHHYLKPGGVFLSINHDIKALMPRILRHKAPTYDISHIHLWDKSTMSRILQANGFKVHHIRSLPCRYEFDHIMRMLPMPALLKKASRSLLAKLHWSQKSIKVSVENMVSAAIKPGRADTARHIENIAAEG